MIDFRYRHLPAIRQYITFLPIILWLFLFSESGDYRRFIRYNSRTWVMAEKLEKHGSFFICRDIFKLFLASPVLILLFLIALPFMVKDRIHHLLKPKEVRL